MLSFLRLPACLKSVRSSSRIVHKRTIIPWCLSRVQFGTLIFERKGIGVHPLRIHHALASVLAACLFAGCEKDEIRRYSVERVAPARRPTVSTSSAPSQLQYKVPEGWSEMPNQEPMRLATFAAPDGDRNVDISVVPLGPQAGSVIDNINRWRGQIGLPPVTEEEVARDLRRIEVAAAPALHVELVGPESADDRREAIVGVILRREDQTWFFKMRGPADSVAKQREAFDSFLQSVRFGESPETGGQSDG